MTRTLAGAVALVGALGLFPARAAAQSGEKSPGRLDVFDEAKLFSPAGVEQAKSKFREAAFHRGLTVTVDTVAEPPAAKKSAAEAASKDGAKWRAFMLDWARQTAGEDHTKGIYVLVTLHPVGGVAVIADRQTKARGFTDADDEKVRMILASAFKDAKDETSDAKKQEVRSAGLVKALEYIATDLRDSRVADAPPAGGARDKHEHNGKVQTNAPPAGRGIMGYVCLGLFVLAGAWLVIGLIRMFTGGGGGGTPGAGGGGGGFMTSLFGGLFGAVAGMWMYNNLFGGGGLFGGGSDAYAGESGAGDVGGGDAGGGDTGAGDWGGGSGSAGGFDDGGGFDGGGGDFGGDF
jgi:uncharacterized protein